MTQRLAINRFVPARPLDGFKPPFGSRGARGEPADGYARRCLRGKRVLVVEDEALVALDIEFAFQDHGVQVIGPAFSLDDALQLVQSAQCIDGAILDVDLKGHQVFPVAELLQARGVPLVFHTGHGIPARLSEMFPRSATCNKPARPEMLIAALLRIGN